MLVGDAEVARLYPLPSGPAGSPAALLEGFAWDLEGRRYRDLSELRAYAARVEEPGELPDALQRALKAVKEERRQALLNVICKNPLA